MGPSRDTVDSCCKTPEVIPATDIPGEVVGQFVDYVSLEESTDKIGLRTSDGLQFF